MPGTNLLRRLRGLLGNAVAWGGLWFLATLAVSTLLGIFEGPFIWAGIWRGAARVGVVGGLSGVVFSTFIGLRYHGRRLSEISWVRFGLGGGVVAGLFLPALMFVGRTVSGDGPLALGKYLTRALLVAGFGAVAAAATMWLAQRGDRMLAGGNGDGLPGLEKGEGHASTHGSAPGGQELSARPGTRH